MIFGTGRLDFALTEWEKSGVLPAFSTWANSNLPKASAKLVNMRERWRAKQEKAAGYPELHRAFQAKHGYALSLDAPRTFNEKVQWRKLFDRNPAFPLFADKYAVKGWIQDRIGEDVCVPTLFYVEDPQKLPHDIAEQELILKATHASGRNLILTPTTGLTRGDILRLLSRFIYRDYGNLNHEWAYSQVPRKIIAEPILRRTNGGVPHDVKLHLMQGDLALVQCSVARIPSGKMQVSLEQNAMISPDWTKLSVTRSGDVQMPLPERPAQFDRMVSIARKLSDGFDYLRVDFLVCDDDFYIGELTIYSSSGMKAFLPTDFDHELGAKWPLPQGVR